jgi:heme/copper-type cytochrome/quinol oxidase subunit 4
MKELVYQRATVIFALLLLVTGISFWLTVGHGAANFHEAKSVIWTQVIILAFVKVRWVLLDFMELRSAPMKLRVLFEAWVTGVAAFLVLTDWLVA